MNSPALPATADLVYVVEDEPRLATLLADYLQAAGLRARTFARGDEVEAAVRAEPPSVLLLDLMLPGLDGLSVCRALRAFSDVPIIMVTARVEELDRLMGLEAGADDYVCKPFSPREVVARVKAQLRRRRGELVSAAPVLQLDPERHAARFRGQALDLTPAEFRLLQALAAQPGRVFSRDQLLDRLHDDQRALNDRTVDSHVKNLRRKLETAGAQGEWIRSVYGVGYAWEPPEGG